MSVDTVSVDIMSILTPPIPDDLLYPDSDGKPMADNTVQFDYITTIKLGLDGMYADREDVFVAGDLLWYPVLDKPISAAPDVLVAFGVPKGDRGSYRQWLEGNIAPQVVFEIRSPNNTNLEMEDKLGFYAEHGVQEYYYYDPASGASSGWQREGSNLRPSGRLHGWVSPRLQVRFELQGNHLRVFDPEGEPFIESYKLAAEAKREAKRADREAHRADAEHRLREQEARRADQEQRLREQEARRADEQTRRADEQARRANVEQRLREELEQRLAAALAALEHRDSADG